ncbi:MAG: ATP-binding protein [Thermoprotei archaeon]|nr:MAG: ATP-binding protein [Thermoprotei archaeon]
MASEIERKMKLEQLRKIRQQEEEARKRLSKIKYKIIVLSGKGGVGKSFITANIAAALAKKGYVVGVLDSDIHGPSIPKIFGLHGQSLYAGPGGIMPLLGVGNVRVVSADLMLPDEESALIWRGPIKTGFIRELLAMVNWGELDYLLVDLPPGTGDEALTIAQLIKDLDGAIVVTTPSDLARIVVKKAVTFCKQLNVPILGIINNMCCFICPKCGSKYYIFGEGGAAKLAEEMGIEMLADIPLDPRISEATDQGVPFVIAFPDTEAAKNIMSIAEKIEKIMNERKKSSQSTNERFQLRL